MKRKNMKYKIFWNYEDGSKEFPKNTSLSDMSCCYKWDNGKNKARFKLLEIKRISGNSIEKAYRFIGTTYAFTVKEMY